MSLGTALQNISCDSLSVSRWRSWLRHCAKSRKVAGSIPDGVTGIFHSHNISGRTVVLGLTQPLTEMSTRNISCGVKPAGAYGWQHYYLPVPIALKTGSFNLLEPSGPVQACNGIALPLALQFHNIRITSHMFSNFLLRVSFLIRKLPFLYVQLYLRQISLCYPLCELCSNIRFTDLC